VRDDDECADEESSDERCEFYEIFFFFFVVVVVSTRPPHARKRNFGRPTRVQIKNVARVEATVSGRDTRTE